MIKLRLRGPSHAPRLHQAPLRGAFLPSCPNSGAPLPHKQHSPDIARLKELRGGLCGGPALPATIPGHKASRLKSVVLVCHARIEESDLGKRLAGGAAVQERKVLWPFCGSRRRAAPNLLMVQ